MAAVVVLVANSFVAVFLLLTTVFLLQVDAIEKLLLRHSANQASTQPYPIGKRSSKTTDLEFAGQHSAEYSLYQRLLGSSRYQKHVRPVRDHHQPVKVKVGMCVMMIEEIIERDQIMTMAACIKMKWTDDFLVWKPESYDNLTWLAISSSNIWLPDIAIINSPEPYELTRKSTNVDVDFHGEVGFFPSGRLATRCNLQITYFPFDWQHCEVRLESWIYPTQYLEIEMYPDDTVDLKEYYTNHQWAVAGYRVLPEVADYDGKNFSSITFTFILRRKSEYYFMYFIFPQLLLALLQTLSHTLPVEHPGRMAMLTSLFIGTSVTQAGVAVHIPKSSDSMSLLQIYMTIMSCNLVVALVVTFVMMYAVLRYPNEEPSFIAMMVAFFSIVWPNEADKIHLHHHNPAPVYHRRQSVAVNRRSSSPYVPDERRPGEQTTSTRRRHERGESSSRSKSSKSPHQSRDSSKKGDRSGRRERSRSRSAHKQLLSSAGYAEAEAAASKRISNSGRSPVVGNKRDMTDFRKIIERQSLSPGSQHTRRFDSSTKRLTFLADQSEENEAGESSFVAFTDSCSPKPSSSRQRGVLVNNPNGSVFNRSNNESLKMSYLSKRQAAGRDSSPDITGMGDFSPMNPNVQSPQLNLALLESGNMSSASGTIMMRNVSAGDVAAITPISNKPPGPASNNDAKIAPRRPLERKKSARGEAASADETRELKRRWLLYCVALDKTIMYANLVWNIIVPLVLFAIVPVLSPHPFLHVTSDP